MMLITGLFNAVQNCHTPGVERVGVIPGLQVREHVALNFEHKRMHLACEGENGQWLNNRK